MLYFLCESFVLGTISYHLLIFSGITPLLAAVYEGHADVVEYLISQGASAKVKGPDGATALEAATDDNILTIHFHAACLSAVSTLF